MTILRGDARRAMTGVENGDDPPKDVRCSLLRNGGNKRDILQNIFLFPTRDMKNPQLFDYPTHLF